MTSTAIDILNSTGQKHNYLKPKVGQGNLRSLREKLGIENVEL
jgi:hypothetical protein